VSTIRQSCKIDGCGAPLWGESEYCWNHDPANAAHVHANAVKASKFRADPRLAELRALAQDLYRRVDEEDYETTRANTLIRIIGIQIDIVRAEKDVALEQVLEELEELKSAVYPRSA